MKIGEESIVFLVAVSLWERTLEKNQKVEKKTFISDCFHVLEGGGGGGTGIWSVLCHKVTVILVFLSDLAGNLTIPMTDK